MNQVAEITKAYAERIGRANERVSAMHAAPAAEAARALASATSAYITICEYNFVFRVGQVLGDARYFAAVSHEADGVYLFTPQRLS